MKLDKSSRRSGAFVLIRRKMDGIDSKQFIFTLKQIAEEKNLPFETVQDALEQAIAAAYRKDYGSKDQVVRSKLNKKTGDFKISIVKEVAKKVEDSDLQISLNDAKEYNQEAKVGEEVEIEVKPANDFGRVAAQTAKQVILQKLREAERDVIFAEYSDKVGTLLNGTVQRIEPRVVYVELGRAQGILPQSEQIYGERYRMGQRVKVYLKDVESSPRGPQLVLSRSVPEFVKLLFFREVPEMENESVSIKEIAREAGARTKIAVVSNVQGVDPVGTFVGGHGTRVQAVMSELGEEKIDIVMYDEEPIMFITNALAPTNITKVELNEDEKRATVKVPDDQLSIAIGKQGQNVRLASKLTGWQIDIESASGETAEAKPEEDKKELKKENKKKFASKSDLENALISTVDESKNEDPQADTALDEPTSGASRNETKEGEAPSK
ncbi:MAG: transcription termination factor NusA [Candidatus Saccharimonadales bacterium]